MNFEVGTDIVSISRIFTITQKFGIKFLCKFLLPSEIMLAYKYADELFDMSDSKIPHRFKTDIPTHCLLDDIPLSFSTNNQSFYERFIITHLPMFFQDFVIEHYKFSTLAGFWAIKESCAKALGVGIGGNISFHDMCIFKDKWGSPHLALHESKIQKWNIHKISVSMSHDNDMALAICIIL